MNNPDEQLPVLLTTATAPASSPANFGPGFSRDHNPGRNFSKLRIGPTLGGIAITQPRLGKKFNPGRGSGGVKVPCICSECGKRFRSWKALFGHMRCHPERQWRGMVPPPNLRPISGAPCPTMLPAATPAPYLTMTKEDYEVCECLLMLANSVPTQNLSHMEEIHHGDHVDVEFLGETSGPVGQFESSSCKKVFGSHQALGGHRASHTNVKGCFALNTELIECGDQARTPSMTQPATNSSCADRNLDLNLRLGL